MRFIYYDYKSRYNYYEDSATGNLGATNEFRNMLGEIKYKYKLSDKVSLIPGFKYKYSRPYYEEDYWRNFRINRYTGSLIMEYQPGKNASIVAGIEYYTDRGDCLEDSGYFYSNNKGTFSLNNISAFAEGLYKAGKINVVAGLRTENNSIYGWASAPRLGLTGVFGKFHFKTLFSGSFRTPGIGNIDVTTSLKPEKSWVTELEIGFRLNDNMFITANVFDIYINRSIMYFDNGGWTPGVDWGYQNADASGSDGFELEYKAIYAKGYLTANYSFYTQAFRSLPDLYTVPEHENQAMGLAQQKIGLYGNRRLTKGFSVNPSLVVLGKKYGYMNADEESNPLISTLGPDYLLNLCLKWDNLFIKGLTASVSVFDLLNEKSAFIQPYNGWFYPYPGRSREFVFRITLNSEMFERE
jgi:outer membrane cobalamin receptor